MIRYFVVFAPHHYDGPATKVLSAHKSYPAALKAIESTTTLVIRYGNKRKGEMFARASEVLFPYATGDES